MKVFSRELVMAEQKTKEIDADSEIADVCKRNCVPSAPLANGSSKLIGLDSVERVANHVAHQHVENHKSVNLQTENILSGTDTNDEQAKILSENKILVERSKGKYDFFWHCPRISHVFVS